MADFLKYLQADIYNLWQFVTKLSMYERVVINFITVNICFPFFAATPTKKGF